MLSYHVDEGISDFFSRTRVIDVNEFPVLIQGKAWVFSSLSLLNPFPLSPSSHPFSFFPLFFKGRQLQRRYHQCDEGGVFR